MEKIVESARKGDKEAFTQLMNLIRKELYGILMTRLDNIEDIQDVAQETIIKAFKGIRKLKQNEYFKTWFIKIAINECKNFYRKKYKQNRLHKKISILSESINYNFEDNIADHLDLANIIKDLNKDELLILTLYYTYDYTTKEIADILNENVNTVKSRLFRAKKKIENNRKEGEVNE